MSVVLPESVHCYLVGGAVRDRLLGIPAEDSDYLLTGATPEMLLELGFRQVGRDFPVFLHPANGQEYALARTECKTGQGYGGFSTDFHPHVSVEEDLERRDLTINAIAYDEQQQVYIDPFNGRADLQARILRHVSPAFIEDPLRVLRVARFAARFEDFSIAPETLQLMQRMSASGELDTLTPERVWMELEKAFACSRPSRFFEILHDVGALQNLFPELAAMQHIPQRADYHAEGNVWIHSLMVLDKAAALASAEQLSDAGRTAVAAAALWHDIGKINTPHHLLYDKQGNMLGRHIGHDRRDRVQPVLDDMSKRLRLPKKIRQLILDTALLHIRIHRIAELRPASLARFIDEQGFHNKGGEDYLKLLGLACRADMLGRLICIDGKPQTPDEDYEQADLLLDVYNTSRSIDIAGWIRDYRETHHQAPLAGAIQKARIDLVARALSDKSS